MSIFSNILILKASAGSGKTHALVSNYICLLLSDINIKKFANVLAVTFTNYAANEMRTRILEALDEIIVLGNNSKYLINCQLQMDNEQVKNKALKIRKKILHEYNFFTVSTIDSFIQRVVRAFAFEFRLPTNFKLQLDQNKVKLALYDIIMDKMLNNNELIKWIHSFVKDKLDSGQKWDISNDIKNMVDFLFREDTWKIFNEHETNFVDKKQFQALKKEIDQIIKNYRDKINDLATEIRQVLKPIEHKLNNNSPRDIMSLLKFLYKLDHDVDLAKEFSEKKYLSKLLSGKSLEPKKINEKKHDIEIIEFYRKNEQVLVNFVFALDDILRKDFKLKLTAQAIKQNFYYLVLFVNLLEALEEYRKRNNEFFIIDLTLLLRDIINDSETPFIYEKIGQRFDNLLIDEFQDTSRFQWENFVPLLANSLSQGFGSLIVGDVKQAIYRWRNGDWHVLLTEVKQKFSQAKELVLKNNYRSYKNIVHFNNELFSNIITVLSEIFTEKDIQETISLAYRDVKQEVVKDKNGMVEVNFIENKSNYAELMSDKVIEKIIELLAQGYNYSDIAILVRRNKEIALIVNKLIEAKDRGLLPELSVLSNNSLIVAEAPSIRLIINVLRYLEEIKSLNITPQQHKNEQEQETDYSFFYLALVVNDYVLLNNLDINLNQVLINASVQEILDILPNNFEQSIDKLSIMTLYDRVMAIIEIFNLNTFTSQIPYLRTFEDFILDFIYNEGSDIKLFLESWQEKSANLSVKIASNNQAITVMTIHGSKGLAFPVVLVPFIDWSLTPKNPIIWAQLDNDFREKYFEQMPIYPVKFQNAYVNSFFSQAIVEEKIMNIMDLLNIMYVAFTRPKEQLIVFAKTKCIKECKTNLTNIADVLYKTLLKLVQNNTVIYEKNEFEWVSFRKDENFENKKLIEEEKQLSEVHQLDDYIISKWRQKLNIKFAWKELYKDVKEELREAIDYGKLMHHIMSNVKTFEQIDTVIYKYYYAGLLDYKKAQEIIFTLKRMIQKAGIVDWFSNKYKVDTEVNILLPSGQERRPDRIIFTDTEVIVLDFKFAKPELSHKKQVREYVDILKQIYSKKKVIGYLLYEDGIMIKV